MVVPVEEDEVFLQQNLENCVKEFKDLGQHKEACPYVQIRINQIDGFGLGSDSVSPATRCHLIERTQRRVDVRATQVNQAKTKQRTFASRPPMQW